MFIMRSKRISLNARCLLCFSNIPSSFDNNDVTSNTFLNSPMAGAMNRSLLQRQLQHVFILTKILDVSSSWCEQTLSRLSSSSVEDLEQMKQEFVTVEGEGTQTITQQRAKVGDPASWFQVCAICMSTSISEAWDVHQKILGLESRLMTIKNQVKEDMRRGFQKYWRSFGNGVEIEIRNTIFPDLNFENERESRTKDKDTDISRQSELEDWEIESNASSMFAPSDDDPSSSDSFSETEDSSWLPNKSQPPVEAGPKKRRGRPPGPNAKKRRRRVAATTKPKKKSEFNWKTCPECNSKFRSSERFETHLKFHEQCKLNPSFFCVCTECNFPARNQLELDKHRELQHENCKPEVREYFCPKCDFTSKKLKVWTDHVSENHPDVTQEELDACMSMVCHHCGKTLPTRGLFTRHMKNAHPETLGIETGLVECDQCQARFTNALLLQTHINQIHNRLSRFVCDICGIGFGSVHHLRRHQSTHLSVDKKRSCVCDVCGLSYSDKFTVRKHKRKFHPTSANPDGGLPTNPEQEELKCEFCDFKSPFKLVIARHRESHKEAKGIKCDQCGKCYTCQAGLKRHLRINHPTSNESVPCTQCRKVFGSMEYMKDHLAKYCKMRDIVASTDSFRLEEVIQEQPTSSLQQQQIIM